MGTHREMPSSTAISIGAGALGLAVGYLAAQHSSKPKVVYSDPDQPARFAAQKASKCTRALDIDSHFEPELIKGKRVLVTGSNRGIGLSVVKELIACGADVIGTCRKSTTELKA